ncbi:HAD family hydrolase [Knoellia sp. CPCC 206450]|uniref:HAD family hydrolase n=1 Tax=Knoellia tibetensis TaxID=3404798 RepID=UPI003B43A0B7
MITALLLDLDGVLRIWDSAHTPAVETAYGLPAGALSAAAAAHDGLDRALTGDLDDRAWRDAVADEIVSGHGEQARPAVEEWMSPSGTVDTEALSVVRRARSRVQVILLVNATSRLEEDLERLGLTDEVDGWVCSADIGLAKPDPDVFSQAALRTQLLFSQMAYVDTSRASIASAEILGIRAHLYQGVDGLQTFVEEIVESTKVHC